MRRNRTCPARADMPPKFWSKENAKNLIIKHILKRRFFDEEKQVYRRTDCFCLKAG